MNTTMQMRLNWKKGYKSKPVVLDKLRSLGRLTLPSSAMVVVVVVVVLKDSEVERIFKAESGGASELNGLSFCNEEIEKEV